MNHHHQQTSNCWFEDVAGGFSWTRLVFGRIVRPAPPSAPPLTFQFYTCSAHRPTSSSGPAVLYCHATGFRVKIPECFQVPVLRGWLLKKKKQPFIHLWSDYLNALFLNFHLKHANYTHTYLPSLVLMYYLPWRSWSNWRKKMHKTKCHWSTQLYVVITNYFNLPWCNVETPDVWSRSWARRERSQLFL